MGSRVARAAAIADELNVDDVRAYHDPAIALANRPCLLVSLPVIDRSEGTFGGPGLEWRIVALSSHPAGTLDAFAELDPLVDHVDDVLGLERAEPARYQMTAKSDPIPAYICTHFEIV